MSGAGRFGARAVRTVALMAMVSAGGAWRTARAQVTLSEINPSNSTIADADAATGGRVNGIGVVPGNNRIFYAASEWGGLFKTTDGGLNWTRLNGHQPVATSRVRVDPSNANRVYATSLFDGRTSSLAGINVSSDAGVTWRHPATATPPVGFCASTSRQSEPSAFGLAVDPSNPQNVFAGTNCGLAISSDRGATWRYVDPTPGDPADDVSDVIAHQGIIDVCGDDGHLRSTDGGATWTGVAAGGTRLTSGRCSLAVSPDESYVLFATVGTTIFESDNAGGTWSSPYANPSPQGRTPFVQTNDRAGASFDLWFGDIRLYRSACLTPSPAAAGGTARCATAFAGPFTRSAGGHDDTGAIGFDSQASVDACPLVYSSDGGVYRNTSTTSPACQSPTWQQPNVTPHALWAWGMAGSRLTGLPSEFLYFGNQDNGTFATRNGGAPRPPWVTHECCDGFTDAADTARVVYTDCCFTSAPANRLFLRNPGMNGGAQVNTLPPGNLPGFNAISILDHFGTNGYVLITTSGVFTTTNIGATPIVWQQLGTAASSPPGACGVQASTTSTTLTTFTFTVQAGLCNGSAQDRLWRISGPTTTAAWTQINPPGGSGGFGTVAAGPSDANLLLASHLSAAGPHMVTSTDGGATWTTVTALDNLMTGNATFLYQTQRGPTDFGGFLGYAQPSLVAIDPANSAIRLAGAIDAGVFLTVDSGTNWTTISDPMTSATSGRPHVPRPRHAYFDHAGGKVNIYVASQGRGLWRGQIRDPRLPAQPVADGLFLYRPGQGAAWVAHSNRNGMFTPSYAVGDNGAAPPNGIAGYDFLSPNDRALVFDHNGDGLPDLFLYRPGQGAAWVAQSNGSGAYTGVYAVGDNGSAPPNGIAGYDLLSPSDQVLPFDFDGNGMDDLFLYRPGRGAAWVARSNGDGTFTGVYTVGDNGSAPPNGIAGYDLLSPRDRVFAFDYDGDGWQDLFLYRPGQGAAWVAKSNGDGTFTGVYTVGDNGSAPPNGIAGYDLLSPADQVLVMDYNGDGRQDLFLYRPGQGAAWVARSNGDGTFTAVYAVGDNGSAAPNGIAGYDLLSPRDRVLVLDYDGDGRDDLFLYRPGQGAAWVAKSNGDGTFTAVYAVGDNGSAAPNGIAGYDLLSPSDQVLRFRDGP